MYYKSCTDCGRDRFRFIAVLKADICDIDIGRISIASEKQACLVIICIIASSKQVRNEIWLVLCSIGEAKYFLEAAADPVGRNRIQLSGKAVQDCG